MAQGQISAEEVFPAYAGMSRARNNHHHPRPGFPRLRGDEPPDMPGVNEQTVFSPPTRG